MSKEVDERVVSLQFDNRHFEQNVKTSMSTIDKLKQSLQFKNTSKSFKDIEKASDNAQKSFKELEYNACQAGFSLRDVWLKTSQVFEYQIAGKIVNAAKKITSALAIDPVTTGFQEYETQINAVQTILANTESKGTTIDDVNKALEELNEYADKTIYNFTEMTRNIGTFTAAGVDLDTSVTAIQGIANLAAVSGSTSQQASTAMYQLSQALSSGTVKLMDWNSVVNAGMGGQVFQDALKETARTHGVAIDDMITKQGSFRETLQEGWLTADILTETLSKFTMATEGYTEAEIEANRERLRSLGYTEEQIEGIFKLGNTATNAATKVKTFTQLWDVLKETAQSGWSQTWKLVVGDFEEAKALLTPFADTLTSLINKTSDIRNRIVQIALDFSTPWSSIIDKLSKIKNVANSIGDVTDKLNYFQEVVDKVWMGDFNNWGDNPDRRDLLKAAGYDPRVVQRLVDIGEATWQAGKVYKLTIEDVKEAHERFGLVFEASAEETENFTEELEELTDEQLRNAGLTDEEIALYRALEKEARRAGITIGELADEMSNNNGRDMLIESFKNIGKTIGDVGVIIRDTWVDIFNPPSNEEIGIRLYGIIRAIKEFTESLRLINDETGELSATGSKIQRIFKGIFAAIDIVLTVIGGPFKFALNIVTKLLGIFGLTLLDVAAFAADIVVGFRDTIKAVLDFGKLFEKIGPPIKKVIDTVREWFVSLGRFKGSPKALAEAIVNGIGNAMSYIGKLLVSAKDYILNGFTNIGENISEGLNGGMLSGAQKVFQTIVEIGKIIIEKIKDVLGIHSPSLVMIAIGGFIISGLVLGIRQGFPEVWNVIKELGGKFVEFLGKIDFGSIFAGVMAAAVTYSTIKFSNAMSAFAEPLEGLAEFFEGLGEGLHQVGKGVKQLGKAQKYRAMASMLTAFAIAVGVLVAAVFVLSKIPKNELKQGLISLAGIVVLLGGLCLAIGKLPVKSIDIGKVSLLLLGISTSLYIMASAIKKLSFLNGHNVLPVLLGAVAMVGGVYLLLMAFGKLTKGTMAKNIDKAAITIAKISVTLLTLAFAIKLISTIDIAKLASGIAAMSMFGAFIAALMLATRLAGKNVDGLGATILKISVAIGLLVGVVKLINTISPLDMLYGVTCITAFGGIITGLIAATKLATPSDISKLGSLIISTSIAMMLMALSVRVLSGLSTGDILKGITCITVFGGLIIALVAISKVAPETTVIKASGTIMAMSIAIGILGLVSTLMGYVSLENLTKGVAAVSILCAMMALMTKQLHGVTDVKASIIAMTVAIGVMALALAGLSFIDPVRLLASTAALASVMGTFALIMKSISGLKKIPLTPIIAMTAVVAAFAVVVGLLSRFGNPDGVIQSATSLSILMGVMAGLIVVMSKSKLSNKRETASITTGIIALTAMVIPLIAFAEVLSHITNIQNGITNAIALSTLTAVMAVLLPVIVGVGQIASKNVTSVVAGILALTAMAVPLIAFVGVLAVMSGVQNAITNVIALNSLATAMTLLMIPLMALGAIMVLSGGIGAGALAAGMAGLLLMAVPLIAFVGVLAAMSGVQNASENAAMLTGLLTVLTGTMAVLALVGPMALIGIGALALLVKFVIEFTALAMVIGVLTQEIPEIKEFATSGIGFLKDIATGISEIVSSIAIDTEVLSNIERVIDCVKILAKLWSEITVLGLLDIGDNNLIKFGKQLVSFGVKINEFSEKIANVKTNKMRTMANATKDFVEIVSDIPFDWGNNNLTKFGEQLISFGDSLSTFNTKTHNIAPNKIKAAAKAGKELAETASEIPFDWNHNNLTNFGKQLTPFGEALKSFNDEVKDVTPNTIKAAAKAGKELAETASEIPFDWNHNNLSEFGEQFESFGDALSTFNSKVKDVDPDTIKAAAKAGKSLADAASEIPFDWGNNNLIKFGEQITPFGTALKSFNNEVKDVTADKIKATATSGKTLAETASEISGKDIDGDALRTVGEQLESYGNAVGDFAAAIGEIEPDKLTAASASANDIADAVGKISELTGIASANEMDKSGNSILSISSILSDFGSGISTFGEAVKSVDAAQVSSAADAGKKIITAIREMATDTETTEDNYITAFNEIDLSQLSSQLQLFGQAIIAFHDDITAEGAKIDSSTVSSVADAGKKVIDAIKDIANFASGETSMDELDLSSFKSNATSLGDGIREFATAINQNGTTIDSTAISSTADAGKRIIEAVKEIGDSFGEGLDAGDDVKTSDFVTRLTVLGEGIYSFAQKINDVAVDKIDRATTSINNISNMKIPDSDEIESATNALENLVEIIQTMAGLDDTTIATFTENLTSLGESGIEAFIDAFDVPNSSVTNAIATFVWSVTTEVSKYKTKTSMFYMIAHNLGNWLVEGFAAGINENTFKAEAAAAAMAKAAENAAKKELDEHSPSKKFETIGAFVVEGFGNGISDNLDMVKDSGTTMGTTVLHALQKCLGIHSPSVVMNKQGHWIVQGLADGIDKKTSAEDAATKKAQNIVTAFQNEIDKNDLDMSTLDKDLELWLLTEGKFATEAGKQAKQMETLTGKLEAQKKNVALAYDEYQETLNYQAQLGVDGAEKTQEALNKYKDELIEQANLAEQIDNLSTEMDLAATSDNISILENDIAYRNSLDSRKITEIYRDANNLADLREILALRTHEREIAEAEWLEYVNNGAEDSEEGRAAQINFQNALQAQEDAEKNLANEEQSIHERKIQRIEDSIARRNTELELWEELYGDNATDEERDAKYLEALYANAEDKAKAALEEEKKYNKLLEDGFIPTSEEAKVQWDIWQNALIEEAKAKNEVTDYIKESKERENDQLKDAYDLASDNANLQYQIWEKTTGRKATSAEKDAKKLAMLSQQAASQTGILELARQEWYNAINEYGENSVEANTAYNKYLREQLNLANLQSDILDLDEKNRKRQEKQKNAKNDYLEYMKKYEKYYLDHGMTLEELEKDARLVTGYDPSNPVKSSISSATTAMQNLESNQQYQNLVTGFTNMGASYITAVGEGIEDGTTELINNTNTMIAKCLNTMASTKKLWNDVGVNLVQGFVKGIKSQIMNAVEATAALSEAVINASRVAFDEHSPSRVFAEIGMYAGMGLAKGLTDSTYMSEDAAEEMGSRTIDNLKNTIKRISDMVNDDIDAEPTIRPVLDLSDVESKASKLNSMLSRTQAMRINSEMSRDGSDRIQNGTNSPKNGDTYQFTQINNSPKALSRAEIYRQTKNQFSAFKRTVKA